MGRLRFHPLRGDVAAPSPICYPVVMAFLVRHLVRFAAQKIAANPQAREKAASAARAVAGEAKQIVGEKDKARAAGRALRRSLDKLQGDR